MTQKAPDKRKCIDPLDGGDKYGSGLTGPFRGFVEKLGYRRIARVLSEWVSGDRLERVESILDNRLKGVTVVLVRLHDPHNGAAVLRTAEGLGLQNLYAVEPAESLRISRKVARGCEKWMTVRRYPAFDACRKHLAGLGYSLWAATPSATVDVARVPVAGPVALLFGNEKDGLDPEVSCACDGQFALPMWGFSASYNVSVSAALTLDRICAGYRKARGAAGDLTPEEKERLRALFLFRSVKAAPMLLDKAIESGAANSSVDNDTGRRAGQNQDVR